MVLNATLPWNQTVPEGELFLWHGAELIVIPIMMLVGIVGNLLVFYIYHFRWRSTTVTLFKRMLAVLDLCSLTLAFPSLLYVTVCPFSPNFMAACAFTSFVALGTAIASGGLLVIIAVDRFMKLCLLRKVGIGHQLSKQLFVACVLGACLLNIPTGWVYGRDSTYHPEYNVQVSFCFIKTESKHTGVFLAYSIMLVIVFVSIMTSLIVLYYKIVNQLRDLSKKHEELKRRPSVGATMEAVKKQKQSEVMRQSAIVFIAVTVVFFASYAPYFITLVVSMTDSSVQGSMGPGLKALFDLAKLCPIFNNVANPFIYSFTSEHFQKDLKKMVTFKMCEKDFFRRRGFSLTTTSRSNEISQFSDSFSHEKE